jgi:hypothetical protein
VIATHLEITIESVEKLERGIRRMVEPFRFTLGEHVRNQTISDVMRKRS